MSAPATQMKVKPQVYDVSRAPTIARFMADVTTPYCAIMSHVGSGKTAALCVKAHKLACTQVPASDGVRYSRHLFVRGTHNQIIRSTLKTFQKWIPPNICPIRYSSPISGKINKLPMNDQNQHFPMHLHKNGRNFPYAIGCEWDPIKEEFVGGTDVSGQRIGDVFPEGTFIHAEFDFVGLDNANFMADLLGYEGTHAYLDEPDVFATLDKVLPEVKSRMGRYPAADVAPMCVSQVNMAYNPPPKRSFLHKYFDAKNEHLGRKLYRVQPPFLIRPDKDDPGNFQKAEFIKNPDAEGIHFQPLGFEYWMADINASRHDPNKIRRRVLGTYTEGSGGDLIHTNFRMDRHVVPLITPTRGLKLFASLDWGLAGAMLIVQVENGGLRVIEEMSAKDQMSHEFARNIAIPHLNSEYRGFDIIVTGDPSGRYRRDVGEGPFKIFEDAGFLVEDETAMDPEMRWSAVNYFLTYDRGLLIDQSCEKLIQGFDSDYTFRKRADGNQIRQADKTNPISAYQDCLQAVACLVQGGYEHAASGVLGTDRYHRTEAEQQDDSDDFLWV